MLPRKTARGEEALARLSVRGVLYGRSRAGRFNDCRHIVNAP